MENCKKTLRNLLFLFILVSILSIFLIFYYYYEYIKALNFLVEKYMALCILHCFPNLPKLNESLDCICD
ncbi:MAG: hypothetical protein QXO40_03435 [Candidatus Aenigmatarchaeota archaeon]